MTDNENPRPRWPGVFVVSGCCVPDQSASSSQSGTLVVVKSAAAQRFDRSVMPLRVTVLAVEDVWK